MKMLLGCSAALLLLGGTLHADEMDRETKGKPAGAKNVAPFLKGSELDKESPEQSHHYRYRGGWGASYYGGGWGGGGWGGGGWGGGGWGGGFYRPYSSFSIGYSPYGGGWYGGYSSFYRPYYGGYSYYRPYGGCW